MIDARACLVVFIIMIRFGETGAQEACRNVLNDRRSVAVSAYMNVGGRHLLLAAGAAVALVLSACSDEAPQARKSTPPSGSATAPHQVKWLDLGHQVPPAQWLASQGEATLKPADDPEVQRVASQLAAAHRIYRESERMIANRAVQLSDMLASLGITETPAAVLEDLTSIAGGAGMTEGFGALTQHYFNLRASKIAREAALATLKSRYGGKRS